MHPHQHNDNVQTLGSTAIVLVAPHTIASIVPEGGSGAVHAAAGTRGLEILLLALLLVVVLLLGGSRVLDNGAVAHKLVLGALLGLGLLDAVLEDIVLCEEKCVSKGVG